MNKNNRNIVLTGIARSGTTLVCYLLNKLPDVVALHEPIRFKKLVKLGSPEKIVEGVAQFYAGTRHSILRYGAAISKNRNGRIPDNPFGNRLEKDGIRLDDQEKSQIIIDKAISEEFLLCVKHPGPFTALLKWLQPKFSCFATIRNPLSILASWNSVEIPEREGYPSHAVQKIEPSLMNHLQTIGSKYERQIYLLDWYFSQYQKYLSEDRIIRYEDIIQTQGQCLRVIATQAKTLKEPLASKNKNRLYDSNLMQHLQELLLKADGAFWHFYSKKEVEMIFQDDAKTVEQR